MANNFDQMKMIPFDAKLQFQYIVDVDGIPSFLIKAAARPSGEFAEVQYHYLNERRWSKGKRNINTIDITIVDAISPSGAQSVQAWLRAHHESSTGRDGMMDTYFKNINIKIMAGTGIILEQWKLEDVFITSFNFGDLSYEDESTPLEITLTLRYNNYTLVY